MTAKQGRGARASRPPAAARALLRVQRILEETCEQDGQGDVLQEAARRKAYRAGINRALAAVHEYEQQAQQGLPAAPSRVAG